MTFRSEHGLHAARVRFACALVLVCLAWTTSARASAPVRVAVAGVSVRGDVAPQDGETLDLVLRELLAERGHLAPLNGDGSARPADLWAGLSDVEEGARAARAAFDELDNDACVQRITAARTAYDKGPAYVTSSRAFADGLLVLAMCQEGRGDQKGQKAAYHERAVRFPDLEADANVFPPPVVEALSVVRTQLSVSPVNVEVASTPPGARILVDGTLRGTTPATVPMLPGKHFVLVQELSGAARVAAVNVPPNKPIRINVSLDPELWIAPMGGVVDAAGTGKPADVATAVKELGKVAVVDSVAVALLVGTGPGKRPRAALLGFNAEDGTLTRAAVFNLPATGDAKSAVATALDAFLGAESTRGLPEAQALLEGKPYTPPEEGKKRNEVADEKDGKGGGGLPRFVIPVAFAVVVPAVALTVIVVAAAAAGGALGISYLLLYPPNTGGTEVNVNGKKLTQ